ncbi:unnamed protein product [Pleuronectes platessa]|uniref:Uncharacterized protein n=1 Tax=Pleuronectes platessa TaxID=8262 RepID=A0A9N7YTQ3_PLEPL|nr:unnamed protein product [Pleuronectes platessa]
MVMMSTCDCLRPLNPFPCSLAPATGGATQRGEGAPQALNTAFSSCSLEKCSCKQSHHKVRLRHMEATEASVVMSHEELMGNDTVSDVPLCRWTAGTCHIFLRLACFKPLCSNCERGLRASHIVLLEASFIVPEVVLKSACSPSYCDTAVMEMSVINSYNSSGVVRVRLANQHGSTANQAQLRSRSSQWDPGQTPAACVPIWMMPESQEKTSRPASRPASCRFYPDASHHMNVSEAFLLS